MQLNSESVEALENYRRRVDRTAGNIDRLLVNLFGLGDALDDAEDAFADFIDAGVVRANRNLQDFRDVLLNPIDSMLALVEAVRSYNDPAESMVGTIQGQIAETRRMNRALDETGRPLLDWSTNVGAAQIRVGLLRQELIRLRTTFNETIGPLRQPGARPPDEGPRQAGGALLLHRLRGGGPGVRPAWT